MPHQPLVLREGPPSHLSITPQGMTPIVHPSNATQRAQQRAAALAGPVLCQGSSALPGILSRWEGTLGQHSRVPWLPPALLCSRQGLALEQEIGRAVISAQPGTAQHCHEFHSLSPCGGDTHRPAHTRGRSFGAAEPQPRRGNAAELPAGAAGSWRCRMRPRWPTRRNGRHVCGLWGEAALGNRALQRPGGCILSKSPGPT